MRIAVSLFLSGVVFAQASPAAPACSPPCRRGYTCIDGSCISQCNPPCPENYLCVEGDCQMDPGARPVVVMPPEGGGAGMIEPPEGGGGEEGYYPRQRYIAVGGGGSFPVKAPDWARSYGEIDIENGGTYWAGAFSFGLPEGGFILGFGFRIYYPIQLKGRTFVEPQLGVNFNQGWFDEPVEFSLFQIGLGPGVRLRYDLARSFAVYLQAFRADIMLYTARSSEDPGSDGRVKETLVYLNLGGGIEIRY